MHGRVTIDLRCGCLKNLRACPFGKPQHIDRAVNTRLKRFHRIMLIVERAGRARQIVNFVNLQKDWHGHIMADKFKIGIAQQMRDIVFLPAKQIIHTDHIGPSCQKRLAQMRA